MRRYEELYQILTRATDLLTDGVAGEHEPLESRVQHLMSTLDGADHPGGAGDDRRNNLEAPDAAAPTTIGSFPRKEYEELSQEERMQRLEKLAAGITGCERCPLSMGRTLSVAGEGVLDPLVMVVGEGPGRDEDESGRPFVGAAGRYLDRWLGAIGLDRTVNAYITNIVKCRPPNNRDPQPEETDACYPWLQEQIALVRPRMVLTVGRISMRILTGATQGITRIHGTFYSFHGIPLVPTFHPSAVLRKEEWRRPVWEDLKSVRNWLVDHAGHIAPDDPV
jgi:uracil-DNA glycosylase